MSRQAFLLLAFAQLTRQVLERRFIRRAQTAAEQPTDLPSKFRRTESLMQRANNLNTDGDLTRRLELAQAFVAGGDDLGQILMEREGADVG